MSGVNLEDFLAEAEELIDQLNHGFLELDQQLKKGEKPEPSLVNDIFRSAHSLKGICGMFGFSEVGEIAHKMEDLLDRLRLQKLKLTPKTLDIMFQTTEELHKIMHRKASGEEISPSEVEALKKKLEQGEARFKTEPKAPLIHMSIGKISFGKAKILANLEAFLKAVKVKNIKKAVLSATHSPGIKLDLTSLK